MNVDDPVKTRTFKDVEVKIKNADIIEQENQVYEVLEGQYVDVKVKGNKSIVDSLKPSDIEATADFQYLSFTKTITIDVKCLRSNVGDLSLELGDVKNMKVSLENLKKDSFPVRYNMVGTVEDDYYTSTDLMKSNPGMIEVKAAESVFTRIKMVRLDVDVSGKSKDFTLNVTPRAYDENNKLIESPSLKFSVDTVKVKVTVLPTKTVPVNIETKGQPADGYQLMKVKYEPQEVIIAARDSVLSNQTSINLVIDITGAKENQEKEVNLETQLGSQIKIADNNRTIVTKIEIEKLQEKTITFSTKDIQMKVPSDMEYKFADPNMKYKVKIREVGDEIKDLTIKDLKPMIDVSELDYGKHRMKITFNSTYDIQFETSAYVVVELSSLQQESPTPTITPTVKPSVTPTKEPDSEPASGKNEATQTEPPVVGE
ncbi:uncharacterized secreted protein associated with spyDAC [Lachnospiraceae bacterium KM106-2]|nr:uncharacterized secreted protein associated with spyDAC [Lachnospiraceae bacterium KM106-2]